MVTTSEKALLPHFVNTVKIAIPLGTQTAECITRRCPAFKAVKPYYSALYACLIALLLVNLRNSKPLNRDSYGPSFQNSQLLQGRAGAALQSLHEYPHRPAHPFAVDCLQQPSNRRAGLAPLQPPQPPLHAAAGAGHRYSPGRAVKGRGLGIENWKD